MNRSLAILWLVVLSAGIVLLAVIGASAARAHSESVEAHRHLRAISLQARELAQLRRGTINAALRPDAGLASLVAATLSRSGLPASALQSLSPEAHTPLIGEGGSLLIRQRATLTLSGLSLPQVGRFLNDWRLAETGWLMSSINLSPIHNSAAGPGHAGSPARATGDDLPLRAVFTIEGLFKDAPPVRREASTGASR